MIIDQRRKTETLYEYRSIKTKISNDVKAGVWYTAGNFVSRGIAFLSTPVFTRLLSKEDYGEFSNFTAWATLIVVITSLDMYASINRAYQDYEDDFDTYMSTISWVSITFSALCYLTVWILRDWAVNVFGMNFLYINMLFIYLLFSPASQLFLTWQRIRGKYKYAIFVSVGSALLSLILSYVMVMTFQDKLWGRVLGYVLPIVMINAVIYGFLIFRGRAFAIEKVKYAMMIAVPLIPHHLSASILAKSDQFMIKKFCGNVDLAVYSFAYDCSLAVSILGTSVNQAYIPWLYRKLRENDFSEINTQARRLLVLFLALILGVMLIGPEVVYIMGGGKYAASVYMLPIIMTGYCFRFLYTYYANLELYCKKSVVISAATIIAAGINVGLNLLWIPKYGYDAAAVSTTIGFAVLYVLHYFGVRRTPYRNLYHHKKLLLIVLVFIICSLLVIWLYDKTTLRRCAIAFYIFVAGNAAYKFLHDTCKLF